MTKQNQVLPQIHLRHQGTMGAQLTPRRGRSGGSGKQAKTESKYKGQPYEPPGTLALALSLHNKAVRYNLVHL